MGEFNLFPEI